MQITGFSLPVLSFYNYLMLLFALLLCLSQFNPYLFLVTFYLYPVPCCLLKGCVTAFTRVLLFALWYKLAFWIQISPEHSLFFLFLSLSIWSVFVSVLTQHSDPLLSYPVSLTPFHVSSILSQHPYLAALSLSAPNMSPWASLMPFLSLYTHSLFL